MYWGAETLQTPYRPPPNREPLGPQTRNPKPLKPLTPSHQTKKLLAPNPKPQQKKQRPSVSVSLSLSLSGGKVPVAAKLLKSTASWLLVQFHLTTGSFFSRCRREDLVPLTLKVLPNHAMSVLFFCFVLLGRGRGGSGEERARGGLLGLGRLLYPLHHGYAYAPSYLCLYSYFSILILHFLFLYCTIIHYLYSFSTILYYIVLCYIILYYIILHYIT